MGMICLVILGNAGCLDRSGAIRMWAWDVKREGTKLPVVIGKQKSCCLIWRNAHMRAEASETKSNGGGDGGLYFFAAYTRRFIVYT